MQGDLLQQVQTGSTVPDSFSSEFNVPDDAGILLRATNGRIKVVPSSSGRLEVTVRVAGHVSVAGTKRLTTTLRPSDPYMVLETEYEDTGIRASADYVLGLPAKSGVSLTVELLNGSVSVESVPCDLDVSIHNGDLKARDVSGGLHARLINGSLSVHGTPTVSFIRTGGAVDLDIGALPTGGSSVTALAGDVDVRLPNSLELHLEASSGEGDVGVTGLKPENVLSVGASFSGDLAGGGPRLALRAVGGSVRVSERS